MGGGFLFGLSCLDGIKDIDYFLEHADLFVDDVVFLFVVDCDEILVIAQILIGKVVLSRIGLEVILQNGDYLLQDGEFLLDIDDLEDLIDCLLVVEGPIVQTEENDDIHVQDVMMDLEFPQERQFLIHHFFQHIREVLEALDDAEGDPGMLVLIPLDGKAIPQEERPVGVSAVSEEDLIVGLDVIEDTCFHH
jgi:hypothetical protein